MGFPIFTHADANNLRYHFDTIDAAMEWVEARGSRVVEDSIGALCMWSKCFNCYFVALQEYGEAFIDDDGIRKYPLLNLVKIIPKEEYPESTYLTHSDLINYAIGKVDEVKDETK